MKDTIEICHIYNWRSRDMSYYEALEDGVRIEKGRRQNAYYPRCKFCGVEVFSYSYVRNYDYICKDCKPHKKVLLRTGLFD